MTLTIPIWTQLSEEALIVTHEELRLELAHGVQCNSHHDQHAEATQGQRANIGCLSHEKRQDRDRAKEESAPPRYSDNDTVQVFLGRTPWPDAGYEATVPLEGLGQVLLLEYDHRIEERKDDYENEEDYPVRQVGRVQSVRKRPEESDVQIVAQRVGKVAGDGDRKDDDR